MVQTFDSEGICNAYNERHRQTYRCQTSLHYLTEIQNGLPDLEVLSSSGMSLFSATLSPLFSGVTDFTVAPL